MAEFIKSPYRIIFDPPTLAVVLLDFGDRMLAELKMAQTRTPQIQPFLRADFKKGFDRGNVSHEVEFSRVLDQIDLAGARSFLFATHQLLATFRDATVSIQIEAGPTYEMNNAVLTAVPPPLLGPELSRPERIAHIFRLTGGELILAAAPPIGGGAPFLDFSNPAHSMYVSLF